MDSRAEDIKSYLENKECHSQLKPLTKKAIKKKQKNEQIPQVETKLQVLNDLYQKSKSLIDSILRRNTDGEFEARPNFTIVQI